MQNGIGQIWSLVGFFTLFCNLLPPQFRELLNQWLNQWLDRWWSYIGNRFDPYYYLDIPEFKGSCGGNSNEVFNDLELYLSELDAIGSAPKLTVFRSKNSSSTEFGPASGEAVVDSFQGATVWWSHHIQCVGKKHDLVEKRRFSLKVAKPSKSFLSAYFVHIAHRAAELKRLKSTRTLYTNNSGWRGVLFNHPSSFDSLALDPAMKEKIIRDLDRFRQGKEFHSRVGRPWKRGYLLYGPPGTGKSSLVAAIANYMKYNVYDLELTKVKDNSELRTLLMKTTNKSIIVIEDIDCSLDLTNRVSKPSKLDDGKNAVGMDDPEERSGSRLTLSGILNFTDGLWSCCGEERIIIFTTNHRDKLDPALLRSGRMDMHIHLSFCAFPAFKYLAFNYLQINEDHPLFSAVEESMRRGAEMTPADISEILMHHVDDPLRALNAVISALHEKEPSAISDCLELHEAVEERIGTEEEGIRFRGSGVAQETPKTAELTNGCN